MDQLTAWLALVRLPGLGPVRIARALAEFADPADFLNAGPAAWQALKLPAATREALANFDQSILADDLRWLEQPNHHAIALTDARYPARLREMSNPPPVLFVHGDPEVLQLPQLAVVGSRNPTPAGQDNALQFAKYLAENGLVITSGLALGVDAAAHQGALAAGGLTIAVCATGLDRVYPAQHRALARQIVQEGALISEFPLGTPARAQQFPSRNRIISGLSLGTLVVEAALRSGSLITARLASEQNREVFAIPGSIHNPLARGCHQLLRQGAKLVESGAHILEELGPQLSVAAQKMRAQAAPEVAVTSVQIAPEAAAVLQAIDYAATPLAQIVARSGLTAETVSAILVMLELQGLIHLDASGRYSRAANAPEIER